MKAALCWRRHSRFSQFCRACIFVCATLDLTAIHLGNSGGLKPPAEGVRALFLCSIDNDDEQPVPPFFREGFSKGIQFGLDFREVFAWSGNL